jgi:hypothetical protein
MVILRQHLGTVQTTKPIPQERSKARNESLLPTWAKKQGQPLKYLRIPIVESHYRPLIR